MNTGKAHLKGECPQNDLLRLKDHEGVRKKYENSSSRKKMRKNDFVASSTIREGKILREKLGIIKKIPKKS
jgi:hypothetical protein